MVFMGIRSQLRTHPQDGFQHAFPRTPGHTAPTRNATISHGRDQSSELDESEPTSLSSENGSIIKSSLLGITDAQPNLSSKAELKQTAQGSN